MAENKGTQIDGVALLDWYRTQFTGMLAQSGAKLMIIGYSFRDQHINEIIFAATKNGLKLFIIDSAGFQPLERAPKLVGRLTSLQEDLSSSIIGGSRRPFPASITGDRVEQSKIQRFFQ